MGEYVDIDRRMIAAGTVRVLDGASHRPTSSATCLELNSGRRVIYYSQMILGPAATCTVTNVNLVVTYASGSSTLGGSAVSWVGGSITVAADSLRYLGVNAAGVVSLYPDVQNDMVPIAALFTNSVTVSEIRLFPAIGEYVYQYAQVLDGGYWTWAGATILPLSSGNNPRATYDVSLDKISLTYTKDDSSYRREVASGTDVSSLFWLKDFSEVSNQIRVNDLKQSVPVSVSAAPSTTSMVRSDPGIPVRLSALTLSNHYKQVGAEMVEVPLMVAGVPTLSGGYTSYAIDAVTLLRPDGSLVDEYPYSATNTIDMTSASAESGQVGFGVRSRIAYVTGSALRVPYVSPWSDTIQFPSLKPSDPSSLSVRSYPSSSAAAEVTSMATHSNTGYYFLTPYANEVAPVNASYASASATMTAHTNTGYLFLQPYPLDTVSVSSAYAGAYSSMVLT